MPAAAKVCFDRILPRDLMRFQPTRRAGGRSRAISPIGKTWVNGSTLQVKFIGGTAAQKAKVREQAGWWSEHANLTFDFNNAPEVFVPKHEKIEALRRDAVFGVVDLAIRAARADAQNLDQHAAPVFEFRQIRLVHLDQMNALFLFRYHRHCFHIFNSRNNRAAFWLKARGAI